MMLAATTALIFGLTGEQLVVGLIIALASLYWLRILGLQLQSLRGKGVGCLGCSGGGCSTGSSSCHSHDHDHNHDHGHRQDERHDAAAPSPAEAPVEARAGDGFPV